MNARRARILAGSVFLMGLLAAAAAGPAAAAGCALSAPAYANVGTPLTIEGSGFPASTSVDIAFSLDGSPSDSFTAQSTAAGALEIALTPEDADIGVTTVQASAGSACTATATYTVLAAGETPGASPEPAASAAPQTGPGAPPTDTDEIVGTTGWSGSAAMVLALALVVAGATGLLLTRSPRRS
jgi:hypothetical protein